MAYSVTNFYNDNAYNISDFQIFLKIQNNLIEEMTEYIEQIIRNNIIGQMETYRTITSQSLPIKEGIYDLNIVLTNEDVATLLGIQNASLDARIAYWNSLDSNAELKLKALDITKSYIDLIAYTIYPFQGEPTMPNYDIVYMDIYDSKEDKLILGVDFEIFENKFYLLNNDYCSPIMEKEVFMAKNITIDFDIPSRYFGKNFNLPKYPDLSKDVLNDMLQRLTKSALGGAMISSMENGLSVITDSEGVGNVYDMISAPSKRKYFWKSLELMPSDFIVEIPAEYSVSGTLSDIVKRYLDVVKMTDTSYLIILNSIYEELYSRHIKAKEEDHTNMYIVHDESYAYRTITAQTNIPEYMLNNNFTTEITHGAAQYEECETRIIEVSTGNVTVVDY